MELTLIRSFIDLPYGETHPVIDKKHIGKGVRNPDYDTIHLQVILPCCHVKDITDKVKWSDEGTQVGTIKIECVKCQWTGKLKDGVLSGNE